MGDRTRYRDRHIPHPHTLPTHGAAQAHRGARAHHNAELGPVRHASRGVSPGADVGGGAGTGILARLPRFLPMGIDRPRRRQAWPRRFRSAPLRVRGGVEEIRTAVGHRDPREAGRNNAAGTRDDPQRIWPALGGSLMPGHPRFNFLDENGKHRLGRDLAQPPQEVHLRQRELKTLLRAPMQHPQAGCTWSPMRVSPMVVPSDRVRSHSADINHVRCPRIATAGPVSRREGCLAGSTPVPARSRSKLTTGTTRVARPSADQGKEGSSVPAPAGQAHVVGIGASAGGLEALKSFFGAMPPKTGLAFVVIMHLDPSHESLMPELIGHVTGLTVVPARDQQPIATDHVYVIPPNRTLTIDQRILRVRDVTDRRSLRGVIDHFFRSLAEDQHDRAVAIVLSGTGTEGTLGVRTVKAEGGLVIAQAPDTAVQPGMPSSAISTGLVDLVLAPAKMPEALLAYAHNPLVHAAAAREEKPLNGLSTILNLLRSRTKQDFRGYKRGTLRRRIERRMGLQQIESVNQYVDVLRSQPAEVDLLVKDLHIGVTSFLRDPAAFAELASIVLAALARERDEDVPLRIWVPGCSTGEEAYSIAIVLAEQLAAAQVSRRVQIFATDIDADALQIARAGTYSDSIALDVSPQQLQRFFTHDDHRYTIAKSIRDSIVFAVQ